MVQAKWKSTKNYAQQWCRKLCAFYLRSHHIASTMCMKLIGGKKYKETPPTTPFKKTFSKSSCQNNLTNLMDPMQFKHLRKVLFSIFASFLLFQGETCCELAAGGWGCCRFQNATCCDDQVCSLTTNLVKIFRVFLLPHLIIIILGQNSSPRQKLIIESVDMYFLRQWASLRICQDALLPSKHHMWFNARRMQIKASKYLVQIINSLIIIFWASEDWP